MIRKRREIKYLQHANWRKTFFEYSKGEVFYLRIHQSSVVNLDFKNSEFV